MSADKQKAARDEESSSLAVFEYLHIAMDGK